MSTLRAILIYAAAMTVPLIRGRAQSTAQSIPLTSGWNSVWLEVDPVNRDPAAVFAGLPVEQVWCYFPTERTVEFIDDPSSPQWNRDGWKSWRPAAQAEAFLNNLYAVQPGRPYLIKTTAAATLTISGSPAVRPLSWRANSFNLVGFPVDPASAGVLSTTFFAANDILKSSQKFRLTPGGTWTALTAADRIRSGVAYWVFAGAQTTFTGGLNVEIEAQGDLDFGTVRTESTVLVTNHTLTATPVTFTNEDAFPLLNGVRSGTTGQVEWSVLTTQALTIPAGETLKLRVGVNRNGLTALKTGRLLVAGAGLRIRLPMSVALPPGSGLAGNRAGLWVGNVTLNRVAEVNKAPDDLKNAPSETFFRVIVHVDATGAAKLLEQVIMQWKDGTPASGNTAAVPGHYVLVTNDAKIPEFKGAQQKDGRPFGYRLSTAAYAFDGSELPLTGNFGQPASALTGTIFISKNSPIHPYRHKFHPDHDGLTPEFDKPLIGSYLVQTGDTRAAVAARFEITESELAALNAWSGSTFAAAGASIKVPLSADAEELWDISRSITMSFEAPSATPSPRQGEVITGTWNETVTGMHRRPIKVSGPFTLRRASTITVLNQ